MTEKEIINRVLLYCKEKKLFRNNTGTAWQGKRRPDIEQRLKMIYNSSKLRFAVFENPRPVHFGLIAGSSDLIGWDESTGKAIFTAVEIKTKKDKLSEKQKIFLRAVKKSGGHALVAKVGKNEKIEIKEYTD